MSSDETSPLTSLPDLDSPSCITRGSIELEDGVIVRITTDNGFFRFAAYHGQLILKPDSYTDTIRQQQDGYSSELCWMASATTPDKQLTHSRLGEDGDTLSVSAVGLRGSRVELGVIQNALVHRQV